MLRGFATLLIALVLGLGLVPGLPAPAPALAQGPDGWGMMGLSGPMMAHSSMMGGGRVRGCGSGQQTVPPGAIAGLPSVTIGIYDGFFLPAQLTVPAGTRVIWVNHSDRPHTTTAWDHWDSGVLMPGQQCEAWFVTPGTYDYLSIVAADGGAMVGTITVQGSLADVTGPSGSSGTLRMSPGMGGMSY
ncbi:MAG TPA: cupredoxin domain-containing protein [Chloroflexota bacterium]|nr:cupredoxin domain-containing protein [Chloroflexota bacterium]